jgi:hypothetical protein
MFRQCAEEELSAKRVNASKAHKSRVEYFFFFDFFRC